MHHHLQARHVVSVADLLGQSEHPHEHGRDELGVGDTMSFDQLQTVLGVEAFHHDHRRTEAMHRHAIDERGGVVERRGGQVHRAGAATGHPDALGDLYRCGRRIAERRVRQILLHALGPPGRAGRVEHLATFLFVDHHVSRRGRQDVVVTFESRQVAIDTDLRVDAREIERRQHVTHR